MQARIRAGISVALILIVDCATGFAHGKNGFEGLKMSKFFITSAAVALAFIASDSVRAQEAPANAPPVAAPATPVKEDTLNKVVCRRVEAIGTRLSAKKVCRTQAQWDADAAANRQDLERSQTQRWKSD